MKVLVTGAAGFIGSNLVRHLRASRPEWQVVGLDLLTYAGNLESLAAFREDARFSFVRGDICDGALLRALFAEQAIDGVFHLAAESHVDRSILGPMAFVRTNVEGTAALLEAAREAWAGRSDVRFLHGSTDEVNGSLGATGKFDETTPYRPHSPYSASKAASDHLVRAWHDTYGFPALITNCTNNYGPYQFPKKLVPLVLFRALRGEVVPVYGRGENVRDWLFVEDHCEALLQVFERGGIGETYGIGGESERTTLELVELLLSRFDALTGREPGSSAALIRFVADRPGHDFRYAMDLSKIRSTLGWSPRVSLAEGIDRTIEWYLGNRRWVDSVVSGDYRAFAGAWYAERDGRIGGGES